jgi:hypothetical protein
MLLKKARSREGLVTPSRTKTAEYIHELARDLRAIARRSSLLTLAHLLDIVALEAENISSACDGPNIAAPDAAGRQSLTALRVARHRAPPRVRRRKSA